MAPAETGRTGQGRGRRAVVDEMRRKVERALLVAEAAEELALAAEAALLAAESERVDADASHVSALRAALARYRQVSGG